MENIILIEGKESTESEVQAKLDYLRKSYETRKQEMEDDKFWASMSKGTKSIYVKKLKDLETEINRLERKLNKMKNHDIDDVDEDDVPIKDDVDTVLEESDAPEVKEVDEFDLVEEILQKSVNEDEAKYLTTQIKEVLNNLENTNENYELEDILIDPDTTRKTKEKEADDNKVYLKGSDGRGEDREELDELALAQEINTDPVDIEEVINSCYKNNILDYHPGIIRIKQFGRIFDIVYNKRFISVVPLTDERNYIDAKNDAQMIQNRLVKILAPANETTDEQESNTLDFDNPML